MDCTEGATYRATYTTSQQATRSVTPTRAAPDRKQVGTILRWREFALPRERFKTLPKAWQSRHRHSGKDPKYQPTRCNFQRKEKAVAAPRVLYIVRAARYGIQAGYSHARTRRTRGHKFASRARRFCSLQSPRSLKLAFLHCEVRGTFLPWATSQGAVQRPSRAIFASLWLGIPLAVFYPLVARLISLRHISISL